MSASPHLGELAALYAVGALDDDERRRADAHAAICDECARLLGAAENDVAELAAAQPQAAPPRGFQQRLGRLPSTPRRSRYLFPASIAAALLLGLLPSMYFWQSDRAMHVQMVADTAAMSRLATTPHRSALFTGAGAPAAHVMYGRDGSWYVVLVHGASKALAVAWMHDGRRTMLGMAVPHGDVALLYLPKSHRMRHLALLDGNQVVAEAQLAY
jgi:hypothetical protein